MRKRKNVYTGKVNGRAGAISLSSLPSIWFDFCLLVMLLLDVPFRCSTETSANQQWYLFSLLGKMEDADSNFKGVYRHSVMTGSVLFVHI
jgi:hypothetical protein